MESAEKFKKDVEYKIDRHATRLGLEDAVVTSAKNLYGMFNSEDVAHSRPDDVFAIAAIYMAHRVRDEPASTPELVRGTGIKEKYVIRAYKQMRETLADEHNIELHEFTPEEFIDKYSEKLGISDETRQRAKEIFNDTEDVMMNKANSTAAASSLYLACLLNDEDVRQYEVARVSGVTEVTIRNRYQEQQNSLGLTA